MGCAGSGSWEDVAVGNVRHNWRWEVGRLQTARRPSVVNSLCC